MKKNNSLLARNKREQNWGWLFCAPLVLGFIFVYLEVIINSIRFCFSNIKMTPTGYTLEPVGLGHFFTALFEDENFTRNVISSLGTAVWNIPAIVIFSLMLATFLNQKIKGRGIFQALFFLPVIMSTGFVASSMTSAASISSISTGISASSGSVDLSSIISVLEDFNFSSNLISTITSFINDIYGVINNSGVQIILFLAGIQALSPSVYEAATIEGATGWEKFWKITFPMISPIILVNFIYTSIDYLTSNTNSVIQMVTLNSRTSVGSRGLAAAMSWMYFLVIIIVVLLVFLVGRKLVVETEEV